MSTAIHRTTYQYYTGVPSGLPTATWLLDPDLSSVSSVPQIYWKVDGDSVVEMTASEKALKDQLLAAEQALQNTEYEKFIPVKPDQDHYGRIYIFSCDFTKKETWYVDSVWEQDYFDADGVQTTFSLSQGSGVGSAIIDLTHGKVADEAIISSPSGGTYAPIAKINGAVQDQREAYESSGGHYTVDHDAGEVTFFSAPPSGNTVTVEYWYSPSGHGPCILAGPSPGKKWILQSAECQFSKDVGIDDTLLQNVILDYPVMDASGNLLMVLPDQKAGQDAVYSTVGQFLDYTYGSLPVIPAFGGSPRGTTQDTILLRWDYAASLELLSSINMRMKVWTAHGRGFSGERATVTVYGVETDE